MTVTVRDELFFLKAPFRGVRICFFKDGLSPSFLFYHKEIVYYENI